MLKIKEGYTVNAHRIDKNGFFIEQVELKEDEPLLEFIVLKGWEGKMLFKPKFDSDLDDWVEGLPDEEVSKLQAILQEQQNQISPEDMNAMAIMELTEMILGG